MVLRNTFFLKIFFRISGIFLQVCFTTLWDWWCSTSQEIIPHWFLSEVPREKDTTILNILKIEIMKLSLCIPFNKDNVGTSASPNILPPFAKDWLFKKSKWWTFRGIRNLGILRNGVIGTSVMLFKDPTLSTMFFQQDHKKAVA